MMRRSTVLLRELLELSDDFERRLGQELSVNPTDLEAMEHLLMSGPLGPSELSRRLSISTASTTKVVDRLVELGHVTREDHPTDRRSVLVVPTATSRARALSVLMPMIFEIDAELDNFTAEQQHTITTYLEGVVSVYRTHAGPASATRGAPR
ncbi:DNA-binding MarR family transcriptional regulator [Microbacterium sp. SLBN-146]|nr:DNA-binding MarR family transcriptional regulator [Microbacterium sp. SLBN-146]